MNGIGFQEILIIAALLLIFVKPQELPAIFRKIGKVWARVYYYYTMVKKEAMNIEKEIGIDEEMKEIRAMNARMRSEVANFDKALKKDLSFNTNDTIEKKEDTSPKINKDDSSEEKTDDEKES